MISDSTSTLIVLIFSVLRRSEKRINCWKGKSVQRAVGVTAIALRLALHIPSSTAPTGSRGIARPACRFGSGGDVYEKRGRSVGLLGGAGGVES